MSFSREIKLFNKKALRKTLLVAIDTFVEMFRSIIYSTPVLDAYLKGAWRCSHDAPDTGYYKTPDKTGTRTVATVIDQVEKLTLDSTMFLTNNLPYATRIEFEGHSSVKAPQGMVRINVDRVHGNIEKAIKETR